MIPELPGDSDSESEDEQDKPKVKLPSAGKRKNKKKRKQRDQDPSYNQLVVLERSGKTNESTSPPLWPNGRRGGGGG